MNEVQALVEAFDRAIATGVSCALATIVSVEGSSYRRPGARMLVTEEGLTTGTISAGCLENDVIAHAKIVIEKGEAKLVEYDNGSTSDEMAWGLGLGCNGIVRVLVEPLRADSSYIAALRQSYLKPIDEPDVIVATFCSQDWSSDDRSRVKVGTRLLISGNEHVAADETPDAFAGAVRAAVLAKAREQVAPTGCNLEIDGARLGVFIEKLAPPTPLVIYGAGHDAVPIAELAVGLGWQVDVIDPQAREISRERFAVADRVTLTRPAELDITITPSTLALVMSHNYEHDLAGLEYLLASPARYIGVMGPRKRTERMLSEIGGEHDLARLHSPVGLDIGANGPTEIALSVVAEIRAVLNGKRGGMLRDVRGPIHNAGRESRSFIPTEEIEISLPA